MKLAATSGFPAPIDPFKTMYEAQKSKFIIANKVSETNHWKRTDKIGDPAPIKGWRPNLKWSEQESSYACTGGDRNFRTFDKVIDHAKAADKFDAEREI